MRWSKECDKDLRQIGALESKINEGTNLDELFKANRVLICNQKKGIYTNGAHG